MNLMIIILIELVRLFFAFDHNNHSKWIRLFFQELETLPKRFRAEFEMGRFVINRSCHRSSSLPIDHAHEQMTKENKGVCGSHWSHRTSSNDREIDGSWSRTK